MVIGGYFELELPRGEEYHKNAIRLNTGRNAFEYILRAKEYKKVFLPYYTCDVMLEPIQKLNLSYEFYHIDKSFRPIFNFSRIKTDEVFVFNNYFGVCETQVKDVANNCKNLIIDNSQAFFSQPIPGIDTFYSPRKFFGLPDGAYLYTDTILDDDFEQDISFNRCSHLLGRIENGAEDHYTSFKENSKLLVDQPIKKMSNLTKRLLQGIDYKKIAKQRKENFNYIHKELKDTNELHPSIRNEEVPMIYPYLTKNGESIKTNLIQNHVFVATYWPNVISWSKTPSYEQYLTENLIPIPIDQRNNISNLKTLIKYLNI